MEEILTRYSQEFKIEKKPINFTSNLRQSEKFGNRFRAAFNKHKTLLKALLSQALSQIDFKLLKNSKKIGLEKEGREKTTIATNSWVPAVLTKKAQD